VTTEADADSPEGGRKAAGNFSLPALSPSAIICANDFYSPALTTVHIPRDRIGQSVFECLVRDDGKMPNGSREILQSRRQQRWDEKAGPLKEER
jgi:DNA-binding LacI/PurR family transcriptional regulator